MNLGEHVTTIVAEPLELPAPLREEPTPEPQPVPAPVRVGEPVTTSAE
jgi:hypothetical protein